MTMPPGQTFLRTTVDVERKPDHLWHWEIRWWENGDVDGAPSGIQRSMRGFTTARLARSHGLQAAGRIPI